MPEWTSLFETGGPMLWAIAGMSMLAWAILIYCWLELFEARRALQQDDAPSWRKECHMLQILRNRHEPKEQLWREHMQPLLLSQSTRNLPP